MQAGQTLTGGPAQLPTQAPARLALLPHVDQVADTAVLNSKVYRSSLIPATDTGGLQVQATSLNLPDVLTVGIAQGRWLNAGTAREPVTVLGAAAATQLGIDRVLPGQQVWLGGQWFSVAGILRSAPLQPDIDDSALIGYPVAATAFDYTTIVSSHTAPGPPSTVYVRAHTGYESAVQSVLAATADPEAPYQAAVSQPSAVLTARAAAAGAFNSLFLGLGLVALIVGAVGVANIMIISVLERRSEIGLRRALGARQGQIRAQFLSEAILLALLGGTAGILTGAAATAIYAHTKGWSTVIPTQAWAGGILAAILIGALAGLAPAVRAARMPPTVALRTV